ncbi:MAG: glycine cleavage system aminomethyltransferase GcvT [Desulfovibrio sp.]|nr:MAG: glycine cleavage system aminomethyltransferase GcvT [Desulfovibrio sp.]
MPDLKTTPLTQWHRAQDAKMAPFAGWDMPIQYSSILSEHTHTRSQASVFDICHMGEFLISGTKARETLSQVVTHNLTTLAPGRCRYGFLLNPQGGIIDDLIVYCLADDEFLLVVNGARTEVDFAWIQDHLGAQASIADISEETAKIDLQGPQSFEVLNQALNADFTHLKYFGFTRHEFAGAPLLVSRTGYTGELGVELYLGPDNALALWDLLLADERVKPAGLGARDTLRLEMGLPLYGQDLDENHTPAEAGYEALLTSEADYIGKGKDRDVREKLVSVKTPGRMSPRHGDVIRYSGQDVGVITSGSFAPSLGCGIGLGYVRADKAEHNDPYSIDKKRSLLPLDQVPLPFYTQGTARMKLQSS